MELRNILRSAFIGHRLLGHGELQARLITVVENEIKNGCKEFCMGCHGQFDKLALDVCRALKEKYKDIIIEVVLTSLNTIQKSSKNIYSETNKKNSTPYSDVKTIMYDIENEHFKRQIIISNQKMIDECTTLICYVNEKINPSGAKRSLNYAKKLGLKIINIYDEKDNPTYGMSNDEIESYWHDFEMKLSKFSTKGRYRKNI